MWGKFFDICTKHFFRLAEKYWIEDGFYDGMLDRNSDIIVSLTYVIKITQYHLNVFFSDQGVIFYAF